MLHYDNDYIMKNPTSDTIVVKLGSAMMKADPDFMNFQ